MTDMIIELRDAADRLERAEREEREKEEAAKLKPEQVKAVADITISEAYNRLRDAGMRSFCLQVEVWNRNYPASGDPDRAAIEWQVWDGKEHTQRKTLLATVEAAIERWGTKSDEPSSDLAVADAAMA